MKSSANKSQGNNTQNRQNRLLKGAKAETKKNPVIPFQGIYLKKLKTLF